MQMLWGEDWLIVPKPSPVLPGALIEVEATAPIAPLGAAHGRTIESPGRKVASFLLTDGPAATIRKARAKRAEPAYTGDYHLVAVLGRVEGVDGSRRVVALAPRSARCANWLLAHRSLVRPVAEDFRPDDLRSVAAAIRSRTGELSSMLDQTYLYSGIDPPDPLAHAVGEALEAATVRDAGAIEVLVPPAADSAPPASPAVGPKATRPPLAILGAGDYVRIEVAPALSAAKVERAAICDREPQIAALAGAELGFHATFTDAVAAIAALARRGLIVVATAHDSHATLAARALAAGHRVICEKPAVVTAADLALLRDAAADAPGELEIGFNRRYTPLVERARRWMETESGPATIVATIREIDIASEHWYLWPNQGTRVAGNLCHWIDLAVHLLGPGPEPIAVSVSPRVSSEPGGLDAERAFSVAFDDGSSVTLVPTGRGDSVRGVQEQIEIRRGGLTLHLDDLWKIRGVRRGRPISQRTAWRNKGHGRMYDAALRRFLDGQPAGYPARDLERVSEIQLAATELLLCGEERGAVAELLARSARREAAAPDLSSPA
jgi:predicted dehydrogenase